MINRKAVVLLSAMLFSACGPSDWERTQQTNTVAGYESFVAQHADSEFAATARKRIEELSWAAVRQSPTIDGYEEFLRTFPESANATSARTALTDLRWARAESINTVDAYVDFARRSGSRDQTARAREAVKSLERKAQAAEPGTVQVQGVFADNMIKYVSSIKVGYNGTIAGYPAKIRYAVQVAKDAKGQQYYFVYKEDGETLTMPSPASVKGTIELTVQGKAVAFELSQIAPGPTQGFVGSFLVARNPSMLWSDVAGLTLLQSTVDGPSEQPKDGEAVLFEVQPDFALSYVP